jgi:hypothetical protein
MQIMKEAQELLPGGVNSPVRAFRSVGGNPIVFDRVKGPYCYDVDGNKYVDYIGSWGPAIVGAANDEVNEALKKQIEKGTSFGAPSALEVGGGWWGGLSQLHGQLSQCHVNVLGLLQAMGRFACPGGACWLPAPQVDRGAPGAAAVGHQHACFSNATHKLCISHFCLGSQLC